MQAIYKMNSTHFLRVGFDLAALLLLLLRDVSACFVNAFEEDFKDDLLFRPFGVLESGDVMSDFDLHPIVVLLFLAVCLDV